VVAEKTAKNFRGLLYFSAPCRFQVTVYKLNFESAGVAQNHNCCTQRLVVLHAQT